MIEDVTVEDEGPNIRSAKINQQFDIRERVIGIAVPSGNFDHVEILAGHRRCLLLPVDLEVVLRLHQEVELMKVEFMIFLSMIFYSPLFHRPLRCSDRRCRIGIEDLLRLPATTMKNWVGWISSKYTKRCCAIGACASPAKRRPPVLFRAVNVATRSSD
jgi:hypothetical protein